MANAICERFLRSVRRECLDHLLIVGERHLQHVVREYVQCSNQARPPIKGLLRRFQGDSSLRRWDYSNAELSQFPSSMDYTMTTGAQDEFAAPRGTSDGVFGHYKPRILDQLSLP